ncbi:NAD(P)-dependent malic enzyme [Corynebacterium caspium]|uniref:NAD(P)-dependent malic enzyme n=1 Tax=Corynebacterium caspium TaxID=234828 RepID=UPI000371AD72|nr:NADP-dependent malic enzyme [Corynebacterium caspium]WKD58719.1 NAD-dependent malic enzyme [Corynebacterium caspium DSM 44850]
MSYAERALELHRKFGGKLETTLRDKDIDLDKLTSYYSPGVGAVSLEIANNPALLREYTWVNNLVAVISDGSAVLGLGNVGPEAAIPVMEGKGLLFKHFAHIDAVPIVLDVHTADEIVASVRAIAKSFGAINLEDIAAPLCFEVERRLKETLRIPVFHDDQHGTAVVALAGLINATKITNRKLDDSRIVLIGAGAAGTAIANLLRLYSQAEVIVLDSRGVIGPHRTDLNKYKKPLANYHSSKARTLSEALVGADAVIGISQPGLIKPEHIKSMAADPIIFALANPIPEIMPEEALAAGAAVVATGRSDYPNQVNNAIVFPGLFRGALDNHIREITEEHKIAAAEAVAATVKNPSPNEIIPSVFQPGLVEAIAKVVH